MTKVLVCLSLLSSLAWGDTSAPQEVPKAYVLATLERTACYGTCPIYKLTVYADGRVEWQGKQFVKKVGKASATLTAAQLAAVRSAFTDAKYLSLEGDFGCYEMTDNPSADSSFSDGKRQKSVHHYHGCTSPPGTKVLTALEDKLDQIVNSEVWIGTRSERDELRKQGRLR